MELRAGARPALLPGLAAGARAAAQDPELQALEALLAEERLEADRLRRRGDWRAALQLLDQHLDDEATDAHSRSLRARVRRDQGLWTAALEDARRALRDAQAAQDGELVSDCARELAGLELSLGDSQAARSALEQAGSALEPARDARAAWVMGQVELAQGQRERAFELWSQAASAPAPLDWESLLARARCERRLGKLAEASSSLVAADAAAQRAGGSEAEVLAELAGLYFEVDGEVEDQRSASRKPSELYAEALEICPSLESALLGSFELRRANWRLSRRSDSSFLDEELRLRPDSIEGLLAAVSSALNDGQLPRARQQLARLQRLAPARTEVRAEQASLWWVEHQRESCDELLGQLAAADPKDALPERVVGAHLVELYRFQEAVPFLERAVARDPGDWRAWTRLGEALANSGAEESAREALERAVQAAAGRRDAWRDNLRKVLALTAREHTLLRAGDLSFSWPPDEAAIHTLYQVPLYQAEVRELAERYGFTPGPTQIQVFRDIDDFSVRSTGFTGFPALGVCFGPVVTAVSPVSQLRGQFSWARTAFHEFTHVIHLGLSHNRCPRWITEGIATWEEEQREPSWTRNMRRELLDARANGTIFPVRELNSAFRGPRILFGYYQGGLLVRMLVEERGFSPIVRLLEAFDQGLDLDQAFEAVYQCTPEEVDGRFLAFVDGQLSGLHLEARWEPDVALRLRLSTPSVPPAQAALQPGWAQDQCTLGWASWQQGQPVDAAEALRRVESRLPLPARGLFLRGEMALSRGENRQAEELFRAGFAAGGEDYRARFSLARLCEAGGRPDEALANYQAAELAFPGFDEPELSAELAQMRLFRARGDEQQALDALERRLRWDSGAIDSMLLLAEDRARRGQLEAAVDWYTKAQEVDPFRAHPHRRLGELLLALGRDEEALREFRAAQLVPPELDQLELYGLDGLDAEGLARSLVLRGLESLDGLEGPLAAQLLQTAYRVHAQSPAGEGEPEAWAQQRRGEQMAAALELVRVQFEALDAPTRAKLRSADHAELVALEAQAAARLGRGEEAQASVRRALELDPDNPRAQALLAR